MDTYTREDIENILKACTYSREADPWNRRKFVMRRHTANRDRAIVLTLLDSGLRASELYALRIGDIDLRTGRVEVKHGVQGGAKGGKGRTVYLGKTARKAVWRYLAEREDGEDPDVPLFVVWGDRCFRPDSLRHLIKSIGNKAGVSKAYPHKFRHTFWVRPQSHFPCLSQLPFASKQPLLLANMLPEDVVQRDRLR